MTLRTPDERYIVVRGRLWRASNPDIPDEVRERLVQDLMAARRAVRDEKRQGDPTAVARARWQVDKAKRALGERGPIWWTNGATDYHRHLVENTPYAQWYQSLGATHRGK